MDALDLRAPALDLRAAARACAPRIEAPPALRGPAIRTWRGRMVNEHQSASAFDHLARQLGAAGLVAWGEECAGFAAEERRHGVLCGAVVEALGGEAVAPVPALAPFPLHEDADPLEAALRNVLSIGCLSETVAVALIGAERLAMAPGPLCDLLTQIYADECGHARFAWRLLREVIPRTDAGQRAALGEYLEVAFAHLERHELAHLPLASNPPPEGAQLGLCSGADARAWFYDTVSEVIAPALEAHGIRARDAWERRALD